MALHKVEVKHIVDEAKKIPDARKPDFLRAYEKISEVKEIFPKFVSPKR